MKRRKEHLNHQLESLYFIALIPDKAICDEIKALKEEMHRTYNAKHALKSPAHITLQMPFRRRLEIEKDMLESLSRFASHQPSFTVELSGFGCFAPKVLYVNVLDPQPIKALHFSLKNVLHVDLGLTLKDITTNIHPHMTIATRDLKRSAFQMAWPILQDQKFSASFDVHSLYLLKHNGKYWDIFREFKFK